MSLSTSTPQKSKSSMSHTLSTPPDSRTQDELKQLIGREIYNQTFQFDPDVVARMLSPKRPRKTINNPSEKFLLDDFECLIDDSAVQSAIKQLLPLTLSGLNTVEKKTYDAIADFLNSCVEKCDHIYDVIHKELPVESSFKVSKQAERWFPTLHFMPYDKMTGDGIQNAKPTKPDIIAVDGSAKNQTAKEVTAWWGLPQPKDDAKKPIRILIPVEVKDDWPELVRQSATYARSQFAVSPLRAFVVVIAINHVSHQLRYLIFHHGGLSASKALKLNNPSDSILIQKNLLSILLWQIAEDAGLPPFTNGQSFHLPTPFKGAFRIENQLHHSLSVRGRNTYVARIETSPRGPSSKVSRDTGPPLTKESDSKALGKVRPSRASKDVAVQLMKSQLGGSKPRGSKASKPAKSGLSNSQSAQTATMTDSQENTNEETTKLPILPGEKGPRSLNTTYLEPWRILFEKASSPLPFHVIVKCSWPTIEREETESKMYKACDGEFGAPEAIISFRACFRENYRMCNSMLLPPENSESLYYWKIFDHEVPEAAENRMLRVMAVANEGQHLDECLDASDLAQCLLHAMLGWLTAYSCGWLHRDVSIGNLLKLKEPIVPRNLFNVWRVGYLFDQQKSDKLKTADKTSVSELAAKDPKRLELVKTVQELEDTLKQFGPSVLRECKAIFTDGDLATYVPTYFKDRHDTGSISGTTEFMSTRLLDAMGSGKGILQTPLDDLWSFFWTLLWATLFNHHISTPNSDEKIWRHKLRQHSLRDSVANAIKHNVAGIKEDGSYSSIVKEMAPLLCDWYKSLDEMTTQMNEELVTIEKNAKVEKKKDKTETEYLMLFHKTAYTGVLEFARALSRTDLLKQTQS